MASTSSVRLYREPSPEVKKGKYFSVIQDNGSLFAAVADSHGDFLFSEKGAGVKPLVTIGKAVDILNYLSSKKSSINNTIKDLPEVYLGVDYYVPKDRYTGLFPVENALTDLTKGGAGFVPGSIVTDIAGAIGDLINTGKDLSSRRHKAKFDPNILYVKFSYLPEDGMAKIGKGKIPFSSLAEMVYGAFLKAGLCSKK